MSICQAFTTISGRSCGGRRSVKAVDVVIIFQNDKAMQKLLSKRGAGLPGVGGRRVVVRVQHLSVGDKSPL